jgi:hypothetical protein
METCTICAEKYNLSRNLKVKCEYCEFCACRLCCETFILQSNVPHCMNTECNREWTRKYLAKNFTNVFMTKKYKIHRENVLFDIQQSLLPVTQPIAERFNNSKRELENIKTELSEIKDKIEELSRKQRLLEIRKQRITYAHSQLNLDDDDVNNINFELDDDDDINQNQNQNQNNDNVDGELENEEYEEDKHHKLFIRNCTTENCRGFLSSKWKCGLCQTWTCPKCYENIGIHEDKETHVCDPNNVETAKLLKVDSKPCPKCRTLIFKISGCDQMFCTLCNTAFSWNTGKINTSNGIHNPHYFEYQQRNNNQGQGQDENLNYNPCEFNHTSVRRILNVIRDILPNINSRNNTLTIMNHIKKNEMTTQLEQICQHIFHIQNITMTTIQERIDRYGSKNKMARINYLINTYTRDEFKKLIQQYEKARLKDLEMNQLFEMLYNTSSQIIMRHNATLSRNLTSEELETWLTNLLAELQELCNYINSCLIDIHKTYKNTLYILSKNYTLEKPKEEIK